VQRLRLFRPVAASQYVTGATVLDERGWQLALARRGGELGLRSLDREGGHLTWWPEWNRERDTVVLWPSDTTLLPGQRFVISENGTVLDTLTYRTASKMPFNLTLTALREPTARGWRIISSRPVAQVDSARAVLKVDTAVVPLTAVLNDSARRAIDLVLKAQPGKDVSLVLYPKAVMAVMGGTNDTTTLHFGTPGPRSLGKLKVDLAPDSGIAIPGPFILQLITAKGAQVREVPMPAMPFSAHWTGLVPGSYTLKMIQDRNGDGRWNTGSFIPPVQPEQVFLLRDPVVVRAGWSVETTWKLAMPR
jgi:hypothetical protein